MQKLRAFTDVLESRFNDGLWTIFSCGAAFALVGLAVAVVILVLGTRRGTFRRPHWFWTFLACLNYVYLPVLLAGLASIEGATYGAHRVADGIIDDSTRPIVQYAQESFLPAFQRVVNGVAGAKPGQRVALDAIVQRMVEEDAGLRGSPITSSLVTELNLGIASSIVGHATGSGVAGSALDDLVHLDLMHINPRVFELLPKALHAQCDAFFFSKHVLLLVLALPFALVPLLEWSIHALFRAVKRRRTHALTAR